MSEEMDKLQAEMNAAYEPFSTENRAATAAFKKAVAPILRDRDIQIADIEREYSEKVRQLKGELAATTRRIHAQLVDTKTWRDSKVRTVERAAEGLKAPLAEERSSRVRALRRAYEEARDRYWAAYKKEI